jgi:hypothetical protein
MFALQTVLQEEGIPTNARWTRIDRRLVNPKALEEAKERFEERLDCVIVLRVVTKDEIQKLAYRTQEIRGMLPTPCHISVRKAKKKDTDTFKKPVLTATKTANAVCGAKNDEGKENASDAIETNTKMMIARTNTRLGNRVCLKRLGKMPRPTLFATANGVESVRMKESLLFMRVERFDVLFVTLGGRGGKRCWHAFGELMSRCILAFVPGDYRPWLICTWD